MSTNIFLSISKFKFILLFTIFIFLLSNFVYSQNDTVNSELKVSVTNEKYRKLSNALITVKGTDGKFSDSINTNTSGTNTFNLKAGKYSVTVMLEGYISYENNDVEILKGGNKEITAVLTNKIYTTEEIDVEGVFRQSQKDLRTSLFNIAPKNIKILPGAFEDVMRSLRSLPGISSPNDFTSQLVIRGSGPDQNLIIMDEVEIFNPYRLYGLVSMFNPETLSDINLITGGFPAKYGDRLSAVLDVLNREGNRDRNFDFMTNINIASANLILQGKNPLDIPGSWIVSSRRTYYDLILGPFSRKQ